VRTPGVVALLLVGCAGAQPPTPLSPYAQRGRRPSATARVAEPKSGSPTCHAGAAEKPFGSEMDEVGGVLQQVGAQR
jgi:hypothetical protein